jgi:Icc-related predicted phosphoesterase
VRKVIEKYQPIIGLHGHIHESGGMDKIGKTIVVNPGSEYSEGVLKGYVIEIDQGRLINYWKVEG